MSVKPLFEALSDTLTLNDYNLVRDSIHDEQILSRFRRDDFEFSLRIEASSSDTVTVFVYSKRVRDLVKKRKTLDEWLENPNEVIRMVEAIKKGA